MAFCSDCGEKLEDNAQYCPKCRKKVEGQSAQNGVICPSCGMKLSSYTAKCPACGHEFDSVKVSDSFKEFSDAIDECDSIIASEPKTNKGGWSSWNGFKRLLWVVLNICTLCIPLPIYFIWPLVANNKTPFLSPGEKKKASLIENYSFTGDRATIVEALLFFRSKTDYIVAEKFNPNAAYWSRLWLVKAEQLHQKAQLVMKGDSAAESAYRGIVENDKKVQSAIKLKAGFGAILLIVIITYIWLV